MAITLEDIERELNPEAQTTFVQKRIARMKLDAIDGLLAKLKKQESLVGPNIVKAMILGNRRLTNEEYTAAIQKFGLTGVNGIEAMEHLTKAQKQYIFKRMSYDINEVV